MKDLQDRSVFSLDRAPLWRSFTVRALIQEVCDALAPQIKAHSIKVAIDASESLSFVADSEMLRLALLKLAANAVEAMPGGGELVITAVRTTRGLELEVADSGPGVAEHDRGQLFQAEFTTKRRGRGWGLAVAQRMAHRHGGDIQVMNCPEGGAAFTIRLPQRAMQAAA